MWKKSYLAAIASIALTWSELSALPLGNPLDASWLCDGLIWEGNGSEDPCDPCLTLCDAWSLRIGYWADFVFDRRMKIDERRDSHIRKTELYTNAGYLALNAWDKYDLFMTVGGTQIFIDTPAGSFGPTNVGAHIATECYFSWSIGARATLWECGCFGLGAEAQYFLTRPHLNYLQLEGSPVFYFSNSRSNYSEYQLGLGVTYQIPIAGCGTLVVPYSGIKWARARLDMDDFLATVGGGTYTMYDLKSHYPIGAIVGITLVGCRWWSFTAEARFADEMALHINSQLRF